MDGIRSLNELGDIRGTRIFVRVDFNVPIEEGEVMDAFRVDKALPTIKLLMEKGAKVILASHIGEDPAASLRPVAKYLETLIAVTFIDNLFDPELASVIANMSEGACILLENLRSSSGEIENNPEFAKYLASLADIYVGEAFSAAHRKHASIVGVPTLIPGYMGLQFADEIKHLSIALHPPHPFLFALGGAKFSTKVPLMEKFFEIADQVFIGGALSNDFFKLKGWNIGHSLSDEPEIDLAHLLQSPKLILPIDVWVESESGEKSIKAPSEVLPTDKIMDSGPETIKQLGEIVAASKLVLWNGPLGEYEAGFSEGTKGLLQVLAGSATTTIVGGGDTVELVDELGIRDKLTFVSTGGGAMLDFLADGELPGIDALKTSPIKTVH